MSLFELNSKLKELYDFSLQTRRHLHSIPELSGEEYKTSSYCASLMRECGYTVKTFNNCTGFIADLIVDPSWSLIAFRADMDALEMDDTTKNDYTSQHKGRAHNCGHDTHMAIALTAANYLSQNKSELKHNVRFVFQMAEEDMRVNGADLMVELGCMEGVSEVYALHNDASMECGEVKLNSGVMSSYGSAWTLEVNGISAHGSTPHKGLDAIREVSRIIDDMDYIVAKKTNPFSPAVFGCGMINGGSVPNAVPKYCLARGTIRAMDSETDAVLKESFDGIVSQSSMRGFKTKMEFAGYPAVINHQEAYQRVIEASLMVIPENYLNATGNPMTGSEDFSLMIEAVPEKKGALFFLGSGSKVKGICNYLHSSPYYVDDDCLLVGAQIFINLACTSPVLL